MPDPSLVQGNAFVNGFSVAPAVFGSNVTAGSTVVVCASWYSNSSGTITITGMDIGGNADNFSEVNYKVSAPVSGYYQYTAIWADPNSVGGSPTINVSFSATPNEMSIYAFEVANLATSSAVDTQNAQTGTTNAWSASCGVTSQAKEFWVAVVSTFDNFNLSGGQGWTSASGSATDSVFSGCGYQLTTATGTPTYSGTQTGSGSEPWSGSIASFLPASSGGTTFNRSLTTAATAAASFGGTKTAFRALSPAATAQASFRAVHPGHFTPAATAHVVFAGTPVRFRSLTSAATAHAVLAGTRTTFGHLTASITAAMAATGHGPAAVRPPEDLGGTEIVYTIDGNDDLVANPYGGTVTQVNNGGGVTIAALSGTLSETPNSLGGTSAQTDFGGTAATVFAGGGGVTGWTMQQIDLNFGEFNDIGLDVTVNNNSSPFNLTGYTVNMLLKTHSGLVDSDSSVVTLSSGGVSPAISITSAVNGQFQIDVPHLDTQNQLLKFYRIDVVDTFGNINTALYGAITYTAL